MAYGIGSIANPGILWVEVLVEPFIQVFLDFLFYFFLSFVFLHKNFLFSINKFIRYNKIHFLGLMSTSAIIYWTLHKLSIPVDIRNVCVFLAPVFASLTSIAGFLITKVLFIFKNENFVL